MNSGVRGTLSFSHSDFGRFSAQRNIRKASESEARFFFDLSGDYPATCFELFKEESTSF
jgi:hypothetical protein